MCAPHSSHVCDFFKVCPGCTSSYNISVVYVRIYVRMIQWQKQMFIYIGFALYNSPIFIAILLSIYLMCPFQHRFSSSNTPRNFKHSDRSISLLFTFNFAKRSGISFLLLGLRKNEHFVFLTFSDSLFEINHWLILFSWRFAVSTR